MLDKLITRDYTGVVILLSNCIDRSIYCQEKKQCYLSSRPS